MILNETPRRIMLTKLVAWGHWFALSNIVIAIVIASIYVFASPLPASALGFSYLVTNWLSHIGFLTFFGFVIFILPIIYAIPKSRVIRGVGSTVAALGLALLAFDALLYTKYGLHISFNSADLIRIETQTVINQFGWQQWGFLLLLFFVWLSFQLILANALWKRIERFQKFRLGMPISGVFVACFVTSHAVHVWADANLYQPIIQQDDMFPLSYPATAKTLMSKYGMLDLENYKNRKSLQFDQGIGAITYPANPVYCRVDNSQSLLLLVQVDESAITIPDGFMAYQDHYDFSSSNESAMLTSLFGLPEIYLPQLDSRMPVMLELPQKLGLPVTVYAEDEFGHALIDQIKVEFSSLLTSVSSQAPSLSIGFVSSEQLERLLALPSLASKKVLVSQLSAQRQNITPVSLYANFPLNPGLSSHLDFAATALTAIGCQADPDDYAVGQAMQMPRRNWLVGTKGSKVVVMHNGNRIEVLSNGNYKIYERLSGEESTETLNTGLLGQAMKHLSRFSQ